MSERDEILKRAIYHALATSDDLCLGVSHMTTEKLTLRFHEAAQLRRDVEALTWRLPTRTDARARTAGEPRIWCACGVAFAEQVDFLIHRAGGCR